MKRRSSLQRSNIAALTDRQLLAAFLTITSPGFREHSGEALMLRNGRWGTCALCPRDDASVYPERCTATQRNDHHIHSTKDGKFYAYGEEISREHLIATITA